jgi:hypothetical protein
VLPPLVSARLRPLVLLLAALLLTGGLVSLTPRPAAATGGACGNWFDNPGTVYDNGDYRAVAGGQFWDSWQGKYTHLNADASSQRYTSTGSDGWPAGHCLRLIHVSGWVDDGSYGTVWITWHEGVCNHEVESGTGPHEWAGGQARLIGWTDYSGCGGPDADVTMHGINGDWTPWYPGEVPTAFASIHG